MKLCDLCGKPSNKPINKRQIVTQYNHLHFINHQDIDVCNECEQEWHNFLSAKEAEFYQNKIAERVWQL